jgi:hypothetical protein
VYVLSGADLAAQDWFTPGFPIGGPTVYLNTQTVSDLFDIRHIKIAAWDENVGPYVLGESQWTIGTDVAAGGDVTGDALGDFMFGDPHHHRVFLFAGRSLMVGEQQVLNANWTYGPSSATDYAFLFEGWMAPEMDRSTHSLAIGDTDGDGINDIVIGNPGYAQEDQCVLIWDWDGTTTSNEIYWLDEDGGCTEGSDHQPFDVQALRPPEDHSQPYYGVAVAIGEATGEVVVGSPGTYYKGSNLSGEASTQYLQYEGLYDEWNGRVYVYQVATGDYIIYEDEAYGGIVQGSSMGWNVALGTIDGGPDRDDLIVGAPTYCPLDYTVSPPAMQYVEFINGCQDVYTGDFVDCTICLTATRGAGLIFYRDSDGALSWGGADGGVPPTSPWEVQMLNGTGADPDLVTVASTDGGYGAESPGNSTE